MPLFIGFDLSTTHGAAVFNYMSPSFAFYSEKKTLVKKLPDFSTLLFKPDVEDDDIISLSRLKQIKSWLDRRLENLPSHNVFIGIEGYAYDAKFQAHQLGEVGGLARLTFSEHSLSYRVYDPPTIKLFVTGKGNATKDEVREAVRSTLPSEIDKLDANSLGDVCDAMAITQLLLTEHQLRTGTKRLEDLEEHQIRAFNRVTKANPVNLLARSWTHI